MFTAIDRVNSRYSTITRPLQKTSRIKQIQTKKTVLSKTKVTLLIKLFARHFRATFNAECSRNGHVVREYGMRKRRQGTSETTGTSQSQKTQNKILHRLLPSQLFEYRFVKHLAKG